MSIWRNVSFKAIFLLRFCLMIYQLLSWGYSGPTLLLWFSQFLPLVLLALALFFWCSKIGWIYNNVCYFFLVYYCSLCHYKMSIFGFVFTFFISKSIFSDISMLHSLFCGYYLLEVLFFHLFNLSLCLSLQLRCVS